MVKETVLVFPERIENEEELDEILSTPYPETVQDVTSLEGDIVILGAGGKIGPSLAIMATKALRLAGKESKVYAVSRFTRHHLVEKLKKHGVEVIRADLSEEDEVRDLPDAENVIFMVGRKFGTTEAPEETWITNTYIPALIAKKYRKSKFIVFSTGNVYPLVKVWTGGATEETKLAGVGEYAWSVIGRERIFTYFAKKYGFKAAFLRLNYACELRYGVLVDVALKVYRGEPVDVTMGFVNVIWQGDVNNIALRLLKHVSNPPRVLNVTGPELVSVRWLAEEFGRLFNKKPVITGKEAEEALISNASECFKLFGYPRVPLKLMIQWVAHWISSGKPVYNLPTHFEVRTGEF